MGLIGSENGLVCCEHQIRPKPRTQNPETRTRESDLHVNILMIHVILFAPNKVHFKMHFNQGALHSPLINTHSPPTRSSELRTLPNCLGALLLNALPVALRDLLNALPSCRRALLLLF